jgi:hypothetical protein
MIDGPATEMASGAPRPADQTARGNGPVGGRFSRRLSVSQRRAAARVAFALLITADLGAETLHRRR